ncbi:hypothetical protein KHQ06_26205 [Nocardia tengchongensis]|uniref:Lipopolysaccharide assembly protein A domain-containing protein n=1 Tax=Nocardia tengchongensis TaxID=2055889 RepID=A0ABX8CKF1_9NOCA|nr:hypothetical protein [Nocardia tengchongensis]QVI19801.1 hypothetical protein KHQ06_26205 [Nocardia tengchongensis]
MIVIFGLVILIAAALIGLAGVLANGGSDHALTDDFAVFGYHVTGSSGLLFLYGIVVGAIGLVGLFLVLAGARGTAKRGAGARRELAAARRDLEAARLNAAATDPNNLSEPAHPPATPAGGPTHYTYTGTTDAAGDPPGTVGQRAGYGPGPVSDPAPTDNLREGRRA